MPLYRPVTGSSIVDGTVTAADLASTVPAALAADDAFTGTFGRDVAAASDAPESVRMSARWVGDGTGAGDSAALAAAIAAAGAGRPVTILGTWTLATPIAVTPTGAFDVEGPATIYTPESTTVGVHITGSRTDLGATLAGTLTQGSNTITPSSITTAPAAGDWLAIVSNPTGGQPWGSRPGENFAGEWLQVESYSGGVITLATPLRETYTAGTYTFQLWRYNLIRSPRISGIRFVAPGGTGHPVATTTLACRPMAISYAADPVIERCHAEGSYARDGLTTWECLAPTIQDCTVADVNDMAGTSGSYEAYGIRVMGCEGGVVERIRGKGCRHVVDVNGGQTGYGLAATTTRPINHGTRVRDVHGVKTWSACVGDHPGASGTVFRDIIANGSSGAVFVRGKRAAVTGRIELRGATHEAGPYGTSQGSDHLITIGEQQRTTAGAADNTTRGGWCGTGLVVDADAVHDLTGNGGAIGATSHTLLSVHPLDGASIRMRGVMRPTGCGVVVTGDYVRDSAIDLQGVDLSSSFSGAANGWFVRLAPAATVPAASSGQYVQAADIRVVGVKPRQGAVYISGAIVTGDAVLPNSIEVRSRTLGTGLTSSSPLIRLAGSPNGGTGYHPPVRLVRLSLRDVAYATAVDQTGASAITIWWEGTARFSDVDH